ncbi:Ubiquitin system component Cue protein [Perilla frutescens var. frutescens]|nr:Ubiquitin system component Cue protein [Perilla frutescens var. frutescens]
MSAVVCGKRSNIFEESPSSPPVSKRIRCSSSSSPGRTFSPPRVSAASNYISSSAIDHLALLFPDMDRQVLEKAFEESGDDLDSAIKRLHDLRLSVAASSSDLIQEIDNQLLAKVANDGGPASGEEPPAGNNLPVDGAEWVELLVREVLTAVNVEEAKARLSRALEALEKSICANATAEAAKSFQKENIVMKQQLEALLQENAILKRAVSIQHERQKEFEEMGQELHQLKQLVSQYQEQLRTLEVNNYALAMHLKQAQQSGSLPGHFHPDVF